MGQFLQQLVGMENDEIGLGTQERNENQLHPQSQNLSGMSVIV
jgi:hypothetical protein